MDKNNGFLKTGDSLTIFTNGQQFNVGASHPNYTKLVEALKEGKYENVKKLADIPASLNAAYSGTKVSVKDGNVLYEGEVLHNTVCKKILEFQKEGFCVQPLVKFLEKLMLNPSNRSVDTSYEFLERYGMVICEDGDFIAYKSLTPDYKDWHTQTIDNSVGTKHEMPRNKISDDYTKACHFGFHVGAMEYVENFNNVEGRKIVVVKVSPENIVCVPQDCEFKKIRVCKYEVIGDYDVNNIPKQRVAVATPLENDEDELEYADDNWDDEEENDNYCAGCGNYELDCCCDEDECPECGEDYEDCNCSYVPDDNK